MPNLDVSSVLLDPDFADFLTVIRTTLSTGSNGRAVRTPTTISPPPVGVITSKSDAKLERGSDSQSRPNAIVVHTPFRLSGPAPGRDADQVMFNGDAYVVVKIDNYSIFGGGFMAAECESISSIDQAPV